MSAGDRFKGWIDGIISALIVKPFNSMVKRSLNKYIDDPNLPPSMKESLKDYLASEDPGEVAAGGLLSVLGGISALLGVGRPKGRSLEYYEDRLEKSYRLDPIAVITAWRRDPAAYEKYFADLVDQGWSDDRIKALKFVTEFMPSAQDLVRWEAREVFEPDMIAKYGLDDEFSGLDLSLFDKIGVTREQALNYWRAHWEHASWNQVVEMVRRGQMTEADVWDWFRLVEIPPFWRDKLIAISWEVPTRVDVRRFYDMRTIDETRLREIYTAQGYHGKDLDDYVLWTKIYVDLPDLLARWKNGWITLEEVRARLIADGMSAGAADELIQTKVKAVEPTSTTEGKELTKTEIYKGVKQGVISYDEGLDLLMDLDYTADQADYLLNTNVQTLTGSPGNLEEFKEMTQKYRKAVGSESQAPTQELREAAAEVVKLKKDLDILQARVKEEEAQLVNEEVLPPQATAKRDELRVSLHRAESALQAAKSHYDTLVAEWRHGAKGD